MDKVDNRSIRLAGVTEESVVDGLGIRFTVFTQGCPHRCAGCHNPSTHDAEGGFLCRITDLMASYQKNALLDGLTLSGGEPFCQAAACAILASLVHDKGGNVWTYSGYTYEELLELSTKDAAVKALLAQTDVLVDGRFVESQKNLLLNFRGSQNQRILNLAAMRQAGSDTPILLNLDES